MEQISVRVGPRAQKYFEGTALASGQEQKMNALASAPLNPFTASNSKELYTDAQHLTQLLRGRNSSN